MTSSVADSQAEGGATEYTGSDDEDTNMLADLSAMFPALNHEIILTVLRSHEGDLERAVDYLMAMNSMRGEEEVGDEEELPEIEHLHDEGQFSEDIGGPPELLPTFLHEESEEEEDVDSDIDPLPSYEEACLPIEPGPPPYYPTYPHSRMLPVAVETFVNHSGSFQGSTTHEATSDHHQQPDLPEHQDTPHSLERLDDSSHDEQSTPSDNPEHSNLDVPPTPTVQPTPDVQPTPTVQPTPDVQPTPNECSSSQNDTTMDDVDSRLSPRESNVLDTIQEMTFDDNFSDVAVSRRTVARSTAELEEDDECFGPNATNWTRLDDLTGSSSSPNSSRHRRLHKLAKRLSLNRTNKVEYKSQQEKIYNSRRRSLPQTHACLMDDDELGN